MLQEATHVLTPKHESLTLQNCWVKRGREKRILLDPIVFLLLHDPKKRLRRMRITIKACRIEVVLTLTNNDAG